MFIFWHLLVRFHQERGGVEETLRLIQPTRDGLPVPIRHAGRAAQDDSSALPET